MFEAEYRGLHLGLTLALRHASSSTRIAKILLGNQGVILDMQNQKKSFSSIIDKKRTHTILNYLLRPCPNLKVVIQRCPGHTGIPGNKIVDKLAKKAAAASSAKAAQKATELAAFMTTIRDWVKKKTNKLSPTEQKYLGQEPCSEKQLRKLSKLPK